MSKVKKINPDILFILICVLCLATGGLFVRSSLLGPVNTGLWRIVFSLPILLPFLLHESRKTYYLPPSKKDIILLLFAGGFLACDIFVWNLSFQFTTIANANLFTNLVPLTIIPVCHFLYKERISKNFFHGAAIVFVGVILLVIGKMSIALPSVKGDGLAFLSSIFYASFLLVVYRVRNRKSAVQIMFYSGIGSVVVLFLFAFFIEGIQVPTNLRALLPILGLTVFSQILGQGGLSYCLGRVSAALASILVLTQPVVAAIYAFLILHEGITIIEVMSMFIVLMGLFLLKQQQKPDVDTQNLTATTR